MSIDTKCPDCGDPLPAKATSCSCGWKAPQERKRYADPLAHVCAWTTGGQRCQNPGSLSEGTKGDGPWYCAPHFRCDTQAEGMRIIVESMRKPEPSPSRPVVGTMRPVDDLRAECAALIGAKPNERTVPAAKSAPVHQNEPGELG